MAVRNLEYVLNKRSPVGDLGIEIEVEGKRLSSGHQFDEWPHIRNWTAKHDGSLRGGMEYITRTPVKNDGKLEDRIKDVVEALKDNCVHDSPRTSCHVHVNALKLTPIELVNAAMCFFLAEEILSDYWGEERKGNQYCNRTNDNSYCLPSVIEAVRNFTLFNLNPLGMPSNLNRYSSINFVSLTKHGSVEFRGMRGTLDTKILYDWVRTCHNLINVVSKKYKSPVHIFDNYVNTSNPVKFLKDITGPYIGEGLDYSEARLEKIQDNACTLAEFAYLYDTQQAWEEWQDAVIKERSKRSSTTTTGTSESTLSATLSRAYNALRIDPVISTISDDIEF